MDTTPQSFLQIAKRELWGQEVPCGLSATDRRQHLYVIGKTGTGKTTLLRNLLVQDIEAGRGVGLVDPHGDLAEEILNHIPPWRIDHVIYFNPADVEHPLGLNLFRSKESSHLIASHIVSAFKQIWGKESWGPRLEYVLYASIAALVECEGTSLLGVPRLLTDEKYRRWVVKQVRDPVVKSFWLHEFGAYEDEAFIAVLNKVGQFLMAAPLRNVLGQVKSKVDLRFTMDTERIFIANLSKGRLGADKSNLLGALLLTQFQLAAMSRADVPEYERKDFFLVVDEFQNFSTESIASVLSEARKYRLSLTVAHQYTDQLREDVRSAVFGNVGSLISFQVGGNDANVLESEFGASYPAREFTELGKYRVLAKLVDAGEQKEPFFGTTLAPLGECYERRDNIIARSRERFATPKVEVENKIARWLSSRRAPRS